MARCFGLIEHEPPAGQFKSCVFARWPVDVLHRCRRENYLTRVRLPQFASAKSCDPLPAGNFFGFFFFPLSAKDTPVCRRQRLIYGTASTMRENPRVTLDMSTHERPLRGRSLQRCLCRRTGQCLPTQERQMRKQRGSKKDARQDLTRAPTRPTRAPARKTDRGKPRAKEA